MISSKCPSLLTCHGEPSPARCRSGELSPFHGERAPRMARAASSQAGGWNIMAGKWDDSVGSYLLTRADKFLQSHAAWQDSMESFHLIDSTESLQGECTHTGAKVIRSGVGGGGGGGGRIPAQGGGEPPPQTRASDWKVPQVAEPGSTTNVRRAGDPAKKWLAPT